MNAMTAHSDFAFETETRLSPAGDVARQGRAAGSAGFVAWVGSALRWLVEMPRRRAVIHELMSLSDHELADIGLDRGDVTRLFSHGPSARFGAF